jgi:hypothetical protein
VNDGDSVGEGAEGVGSGRGASVGAGTGVGIGSGVGTNSGVCGGVLVGGVRGTTPGSLCSGEQAFCTLLKATMTMIQSRHPRGTRLRFVGAGGGAGVSGLGAGATG